MLRAAVGVPRWWERVRFLSKIDCPEDLRRLSRREVAHIATELRQELIAVGAAAGGHFAASLGAVELTVALHYVFDTPRDRLVWDVGHQAYGHKALTGRRGELRRIKRSDGPSGFLRRTESPYDAFGAGHAGTSVSAALGIAEALRAAGDERKVVAVIGDGGATAGMSFEALNHAGHLGSDLRVVFNDNGMSIAPNVGGLARTGAARSYFEALGLRYLGPVDGHDLGALLEAVEALRDAQGPTVLHARTRKGRGYPPAEADPYRWHATTPFDSVSGKRLAGNSEKAPSWTSAFADALLRIAARDPRVVVITAAMPDGTGIDRFAARYPQRAYDAGIAEQHAVTFAAGLAAEGMRPVCAIYSSFLQRAFDQIVHDVALQELPVTFAIDRAGLVGADGPTHHGALDIAYLRMIPNLVIAAPRDENELQHQLATAMECGRPFAVRFPRGPVRGVPIDPDPKPLPIGRGELLREGDDVALVGLGKTVAAVEEAAERLARRGISAAVVDARWVKPLDAELLAEVGRRCGCLVTVEDHALPGGFGSAVLEALAPLASEIPVRRLGLPDRFVEHGSVEDQWRKAGIDVASIVDAAMRQLEAHPPGTPCLWRALSRAEGADA
ncbi:MAG: 1-deoxy-D-xylulose-5-phosphate synthase [Deltaproteobacteria bacterium]|nr:1-deoxy-D-xylulose-5-phosphate synthase [Deltaproteobacteria bacterium]